MSSSALNPVSFSATRFGPQSLAEWLVFPFMLLVKLEGYVAEPEFRDARPAAQNHPPLDLGAQ